eukprot:TRINITY_DN136428_c0_g1_i1.p1 TRINITY_DN136428_c0_g1~~TRINITY_DN136428_c0_g1_i1.p1  ORF type:complete len:126 (+),score=36.52 TRINITY_DN136428_c0_g1_i1:88-465(+)
MVDNQLVGKYDWEKGGSMEKYKQEVVLNGNGTASYYEYSETNSEMFTRTGSGTWSVDSNGTVWVKCDELRKETKMKKRPIPNMPGFEDGVKVDYNIAVDIPADKLRNAPPSGPSAPKNRWRRVAN